MAASTPRIQHDLLGQAESQIVVEEFAVGLDIDSQPVEMIQPAHVAAARGKPLGLILERGPQRRRSLIPLRFVVQLDLVPVRVAAYEGGAVAEVAVVPPYREFGAFERGDAALQRLRAAGAEGHVPHSGSLDAVSLSV